MKNFEVIFTNNFLNQTTHEVIIMKSKLIRPPGLFLRTGVLALFAMTLAWLPQANAAVTAGAVIENIATVDWEDSAANTYSAEDYTQVTVNLVAAAVSLTGRPTGANPGDTAAVPVAQTVLSGATATYLYAITANSNGSDVYNFRVPTTGLVSATNDGGSATVNWNLMAPNGTSTVGGADPATVTLGSAIVAVTPVAANVLSFPGGSLSGFADGDIVVINGVDYAIDVAGVSAGVAPDRGTTTAETLGTLTFVANASGSNTAPNFVVDGIVAGDIAAEQQLFRVTVTATNSPASATATAVHDVLLDTAAATNETNLADITTTFDPLPTVSITKEVRNITANSAFGATGTGDPGDILEYRLTISNAGSTAEAVVVTDPVPTYTTLETFLAGTGYPNPLAGPPSTTLGDGSGAATNIFAHVSDSAGAPVTVGLTVQNSDDESASVASGDTTGTVAGSTLSIYVGRDQAPTNTGPTVGGDIADSTGTPADVFLIYYRVRILP